MSTYKLTYFNLMGLGESVRFMLSYIGQDFEDMRVSDYRSWRDEYKPKMPFGKLPLLEIDDKKLHQTLSICRYLGKKAGIAGEDDWESLQIDMVMDSFSDLRAAIWPYFYSTDEDYKRKTRDFLFNKTIPYYLGKFDDIIKQDGYLANKKLSWGDIYFVSVLDYFSFMVEMDICDKYENIRHLRDEIHAIPNIKKWIDKRPVSDW